jgi:hypothetical protein
METRKQQLAKQMIRGGDIMNKTDLLIAELTEEAEITRRVLERATVDPTPKVDVTWAVALHVAVIPGSLAEFFSELTRETPSPKRPLFQRFS